MVHRTTQTSGMECCVSCRCKSIVGNDQNRRLWACSICHWPGTDSKRLLANTGKPVDRMNHRKAVLQMRAIDPSPSQPVNDGVARKRASGFAGLGQATRDATWRIGGTFAKARSLVTVALCSSHTRFENAARESRVARGATEAHPKNRNPPLLRRARHRTVAPTIDSPQHAPSADSRG